MIGPKRGLCRKLRNPQKANIVRKFAPAIPKAEYWTPGTLKNKNHNLPEGDIWRNTNYPNCLVI
jgi:hypothetical protein